MDVLHQGRVDRELAQSSERGENLDPVALEIVREPQDPAPLPLKVPVVEPAVRGGEVDVQHLLLLGRQVGGDLLLGPAQQERPDPAPQPRQEGSGLR